MQNVDGAWSNRESLGQRKGLKIHQGAITHEICCLAAESLQALVLRSIQNTANLVLLHLPEFLEE